MSSPVGFRFRGGETTRLEAFVDAAFAFALTLLVISFDAIPGSYDELVAALREVPAFLASFSIMTIFWLGHRTWSNRFGMDATFSTVASLGLVFVILVYVYPLRTVMAAASHHLTGGWAPPVWTLTATDDLRGLFAIYGVGFAVSSLLIASLNIHAFRKRASLQLTAMESHWTISEIAVWLILAACGAISIGIALLAPAGGIAWAGWIYCFLPVVMFAFTRLRQRR